MWPLRPWVRLCAALLLVSAATSELWYVVGPTVCVFTPPDSPTPADVHCDVGGNSITIKSAELHATIKAVSITNASIIDVQDGALSHLEGFETAHFSGADRLLLRPDSVAGSARAADGATSVTIEGVRDVTLFADAFSGWRRQSINVTVSEVKTCSVSDQAFPTGSNLSRVLLENISNINMNNGSFSAAFSELQLINVSSSYSCLADTFPGQIDRLLLDSVTLDRIDPGCFRSSYPWRSLDIRSSRLGAIPQRAFTGEIQHVRVEATELLDISPGGFDLNVTSFTMEGCIVSSLARHGLRVSAEDSITLSMSNISQLDGEALLGLRSANSSGPLGVRTANSSGLPITVRQLVVTSAADGALMLTSRRSSSLSDILLGERCLCGAVAGRAARLALGADRPLANLTDSEVNSVRQTAAAVRCRHGDDTVLLSKFFCSQCGWRSAGPGGGGDSGENSTRQDAGRLLWCPVTRPSTGGRWLLWPFVFMLVLLLVMAGCGPLLMARRCRWPGDWGHRRRREDKPAAPESGQPSDGAGHGAVTRMGADVSQEPDGGLKTAVVPRGRHLSWRVVGELEPEYDEVPSPAELPLKKVDGQRARHVSWRVAEELQPQHPEYSQVVTTDQLHTQADVSETWTPGRLRTLDEPQTEPNHAEVLPSGAGAGSPYTDSELGDVFQSLKSIPEPEAEIQTELMLAPDMADGSGHGRYPGARS